MSNAYFMFAGAKNKYLAYWSPLVATVALVVTGSELTGPSMNPAFVSPTHPVHYSFTLRPSL